MVRLAAGTDRALPAERGTPRHRRVVQTHRHHGDYADRRRSPPCGGDRAADSHPRFNLGVVVLAALWPRVDAVAGCACPTGSAPLPLLWSARAPCGRLVWRIAATQRPRGGVTRHEVRRLP